MKRHAVLIVALLFTAALYGCGRDRAVDSNIGDKPVIQAQTPSQVPGENPLAAQLRLVKKNNKAPYLITNGIETQDKEVAIPYASSSLTLRVPRISGLADRVVESKINRAIVEDIQARLKDRFFHKEKNLSYYAAVELNVNNLISISVRDNYHYFPEFALLYRLTDGKRLHLEDLFTKGTDYVKLLDREITESIISGLPLEGYEGIQQDEDLLRSPFSGIKPDQDFMLSERGIDLLFKSGEAGFAKQQSVSISMAAIDDCVDVFDRYAADIEHHYLKNDSMVKRNNIFFARKSEIVQGAAGKVLIKYCAVSGLEDAGLERQINEGIKTFADESLKEIKMRPKSDLNLYSEIAVSNTFNGYGIVSFERNVSVYTHDSEEHSVEAITYDLNKKQQVNPRDILMNYMETYPEQKAVFSDLVRVGLKRFHQNNADYIDSVDSKIDYPFIMEYGEYISFQDYDEMAVAVTFRKNAITGNEEQNVDYCSIPLKSLLKETPEEFFGL